ncbi:MAG: serine/threonine-protein phosphatase [Gammaproteobacteria bacterium]|nr:serine/threonine-protein phosphatase [Gammaproteobacteria bacterium]
MEHPDTQSQWYFEFRSDPGKVRELNEDACLCEPNLGLWVVADGMGGHSCGEVASAMAISSIRSSIKEGRSLSEAVQQAHHDILKAASEGNGADGMGTTVVALQDFGNFFTVAWVGDSRAYLWQDDRRVLTQITQDHSLVERLLSSGLINEQEAKVHPQRHLITQCLGSKELDEVKVSTVTKDWEPEQIVLLCSDGLTEELTDADMSTIFAAQPELDKISDRLLRTALNKGGQDNISMIVVRSPRSKPTGMAGIIYSLKVKFRRLFGH